MAASPGSRVGVLTGGRLTLEDAYAYSKFARAVLGTNNIDFRSRPHSDEEAEFLARAVAPAPGVGVSYADLERPSGCCWSPRARGRGRRDLPAAAQGVPQEGPEVVDARALPQQRRPQARRHPDPDRPRRAEPATLDRAAATISSRSDSVILVGERAALLSGTLTAVLRLAERTGARLAWVPRRAGDRGRGRGGLPAQPAARRPSGGRRGRPGRHRRPPGGSTRCRRGRAATPTRCCWPPADGELGRADRGRRRSDRPARSRRPRWRAWRTSASWSASRPGPPRSPSAPTWCCRSR